MSLIYVVAAGAAATVFLLIRRRMRDGPPQQAEKGMRLSQLKLKAAVSKVLHKRRFSNEAITPTKTDAPLQQAITHLKNMGAKLEADNKLDEAEGVLQVIELLHKSANHRRGSAKRIFSNLLKDATEQEALGMRQWVADDDDAPLVSKTNSAATQNSLLSSRVMKWTRKIPRLALASSSTAQLAHMLEHEVLNWEFDMNKLHELSGGHAMVAFGWAVIERHGLRAKLDLRTDAVLELLCTVEQGYKPVAYHNSIHGSDVTHALHWLVCSEQVRPMLEHDPLLLFTTLLSAMVHDIGHDGYNNAFHINSNSDIAVRSCYSSPLERHHLASAFAILARENSVLAGLELAERKQAQTWMRELILATDFGVHHSVISEFKALVELRGVVSASADKSAAWTAAAFEGDEKILALKMAIKTADLGYLTKGEALCKGWTERVLEEFFTQGDTEKELGLPVSFGCDRSLDVPQLQIGFYKTMITPMYTAMDLLVPMAQQLKNLDTMYTYWQAKKVEQDGPSRPQSR